MWFNLDVNNLFLIRSIKSKKKPENLKTIALSIIDLSPKSKSRSYNDIQTRKPNPRHMNPWESNFKSKTNQYPKTPTTYPIVTLKSRLGCIHRTCFALSMISYMTASMWTVYIGANGCFHYGAPRASQSFGLMYQLGQPNPISLMGIF